MKQALVLWLTALVFGLPTLQGHAEAWPARPIKVIVPITPGSVIDVAPRVVFEQLATQLGQTVVVENRPGAGQTMGASAVARSEPDGYTLLVNSAAHAIAPALYPNLDYHPARDFAAVVPLGLTPFVLVAPPERGFRTAAELVAAAKARPGGFNFSSPGVGSASHLSAERFHLSAKVAATHVPFKGGAEAMTEVIAGRIDFAFIALGAALPHIRSGRLVALAVNGAARSPSLPDVPTLRQAGFTDAEYPMWFGVFVPVKTPRSTVERLHRETVRALQEPRVRERLAGLGVDPLDMTPTEFDALVQKEVEINAGLVKAIGLKTQ
ncbi:MAG: tripartite tricarboxylate transporter substrate binding protein [Burkholderiales bacterium]|nr:tripartite tricarboxylate transporter substrate binding protein [Burkholderiales bacterium]